MITKFITKFKEKNYKQNINNNIYQTFNNKVKIKYTNNKLILVQITKSEN